MDFIKKAAEGMKGNQSGSTQQSNPGDQDYVDKAFDFAAKKSGHNMDRSTEEKITDAGRNAYEKLTGNKVDPKISN
ncbi:uncharacterized protein N7498_005285 [Penicillium cinerascens]|uniref:Uncharacterized protein n=1 Tax=Penicillium cinerascens TaxID=70096 RepID=A0A9W9MN61_9EURO|nr:uncharacterized protein N7498_005285 [Penicillium cinerascens]KAJ5204406.1 hypothetical protein N7498_005285 [Penicillium cinerascens]